MHTFKLLIDGKLVDGASEMDVINPATENLLARSPRADERQLNQAIAAAKAAFPAWSNRSQRDRGALVTALADALETRIEEFARLLVMEQGKPLTAARHEMIRMIGMLRANASLELPARVIRDDESSRIVEERRPLGVVAAITPWNLPMFLLATKLAPGLVAGNTLVVKPAPTTPLTTCLLGEILAEILPAGVVNIVVDQNDLGSKLTSHPDVAKIAFTGSTATGRRVMGSAAPTIKRLTLELGGNDAALILDDANPRQVATALFRGAMNNSGQLCIGVKRVYAHESLYDEVCAALAEEARAAVVDDGLVQGAQFGPVQNRAQFERVRDLIEECRTQGRIIAGGEHTDRQGYFIRPTIVRDIDDNARIVREEQFGPVLPVLRYSDIDEVIGRINDSEYGLAASVWGSDIARATELGRRIDAGTVWINKMFDLPFDVPFRGAKQSGLGTEFGREGLEEYTQAKILNAAKTH
jgi:acyl-CoA reductase-like NAD-dependent aldehyde dehydrogenase